MSEPNATRTDDELIKRFKAGDQKAFDLLVIKYQSRVQAVISRYLSRDLDSVEDVAQEAFIKAYRALPKFRGDSQFYTWLFRIAVNCAKNYLSSRSTRAPLHDVSIDDEDFYSDNEALKSNDTPENSLHHAKLAANLQKVLDTLPEDLRNAISLREFSGMSYEDIAVVMDCPVGTVRSRIFRGRELLSSKLLNQYDD